MNENKSSHETIIVLDFGGQYNQLIARRIREEKVFCEVLSWDTPLEKIKEKNPRGIIFSGGPDVVTETGAPIIDRGIFELGVPILGLCYGHQMIAYLLGGKVEAAAQREYGKTELILKPGAAKEDSLFEHVAPLSTCWMSHTYYVSEAPAGFEVWAETANCPNAAMADEARKIYGLQFHPEVNHTEFGKQVIHNFLYEVCHCNGDWTMSKVAEETVVKLREKIGEKKVLCALSGGVDSTVAAVLINKAVGDQLTCILVDHGLMRLNECEEVEAAFAENFQINLIKVNAQERFLGKLAGVSDPEAKRKIIGEEFIRVFEEEAKKIGKVDFLVQGTIYPDVIESGTKNARVIKSHHNVGGLPEVIDFEEIIEPLRDLFKDEVRELGMELGIPENLVWRQPFPGPGLGIRIIGDINEEKLGILRAADAIFRAEVMLAGLHREINQYFVVLTNMRSVGVMGDERTYDYAVALRGVTTTDFMTAEWAKIPFEVLEKVSARIVNEVKHINRVVYDITSKPPATIEWE